MELNNNFVIFSVNNFHEVDLIKTATEHEVVVFMSSKSSEVRIWTGPDNTKTVFTQPEKTEFGYKYYVAVNNGHITKGLFLDIEGSFFELIKSFGC